MSAVTYALAAAAVICSCFAVMSFVASKAERRETQRRRGGRRVR